MLAEIQQWIQADKVCAKCEDKLKLARACKASVSTGFYKFNQTQLQTLAREVKKLDYRLSLKDRRARQIAAFDAYAKAYRKIWARYRRDQRSFDISITRTSIQLAKRQGFLREHWETTYVRKAQMEATRLERKKLLTQT